jgi:hypothetical protein
MNNYLLKTTPPIHAGLTSISVQIKRATLLAAALGTTVVLATGCSSTGTGFHAGLISPIPTSQRAANLEDDNWYQPSRSPAFDSDLFGS